MKFDKKTGLPALDMGGLSEKDVADARAITRTMQTQGWKILQRYQEIGTQSILDAGKSGVREKDSIELSKEKWAVLKGWDECRTLAERIVQRAKDYAPENQEDPDEGNEE